MNMKTVLCSLLGFVISLQSLKAQGDFGEHRDPAEALAKPEDKVVLPTDEEIAKQVAMIRESSLQLVARDPDGWDDLWVMIQRAYDKNYNFDPADRKKDTDGDGMSDYEEMLVHRDATRREPVYTKEQMVQMVRLARAAKIQSERDNLRALLPLITEGLRTAQAAVPAVVSEEEAAPQARKERLLNAAEALLNHEEQRKMRAVKSLSREARDLLGERAVELQVTGGLNGMLELVGPDNLVAAQTMSTNTVWPGGASSAPDVTGLGQQIGIWEAGGGVFGRQQEFVLANGTSRVSQIDSPAAELFPGAFGTANLSVFNFHATQVAGVLASAGGVSTARGMAYESTLAAYGSSGDIAEMMGAAASGMRLSNHSYSNRYGWLWTGSVWVWLGPAASGEDPRFGLYQRQSREIDIVAYENPRYLSLWSSGNEGAEVGPVNSSGVIPAGTSNFRVADDDGDGNYTVTGPFTTVHPSDSGAPLSGATAGVFAANLNANVPGGIGVDTLKSSAVAKNNLAIGAIEDIAAGYSQPSNVSIGTFSSRGPTDDGRVKPDLVANGTTMTSPTFTLGTALTVANASFESPAVAVGASANGSTNWSEDTPGSGSAQTVRIANFRQDTLQVLRINTANYRVWQDLTSANLTANTQYVLSIGLGKLTGTTPATNQVKVFVYTNGFSNLLAEQTFSPGKLTPFTNDPGAFGDFQMGFYIGATVPSGTLRIAIQNLGGGVAFADDLRLNVAPANFYGTDSGTSFSTPAVTGSLALLQQENANFGNAPLLASTWKALLINTADDGDRLPAHYNDVIGSNPNLYPGPDYYYGWGLMNTRRAAEALAANQAQASKRTHLREHTLFSGNTVEVPVLVVANTPQLQVTLCWTDPAYQSVNTASGVDENLPAVTVDNATATLINDLDLKIVRPEGGAAVEAWKLNPAAPRTAAVRGDNTVDNVEQVTVTPLSGSFLTAGTYKLQITHKGSLRRAQQTSSSPLRYQLLTGEYQKFSLAVAGNVARDGERLAVTSVSRAITGTNALVPISWSAVKGLRYRIQRSLDLQSWTDLAGDITATTEAATTTVTEGLGVTKVFYRVKEVSP